MQDCLLDPIELRRLEFTGRQHPSRETGRADGADGPAAISHHSGHLSGSSATPPCGRRRPGRARA